MAEKKEDFVVTDRRLFTPEGEMRPDVPEEEPSRPAPPQKPSAPAERASKPSAPAPPPETEAKTPTPPSAEEQKAQARRILADAAAGKVETDRAQAE